ncbi:MAG: sulfurtransferase [Corynebacterium sp.]|nr:sulfurtransferase [Corynebacterium sp.]
MTIEDIDTNPVLAGYSHPERIVTGQWLSARIGRPNIKVVEVDENPLLYNIGHIPSAMRIDWKSDLSDASIRDVVSAEDFAKLMSAKGIRPDDTVIIYGDGFNSWAAYALWIFDMYGHKDVRLLNGGREGWMSSERETSFSVTEPIPSEYPVPETQVDGMRAFHEDVRDCPILLDVRPESFYNGTHEFTEEDMDMRTARAGHIPGAKNIPWDEFIFANGSFKTSTELKKLFTNFSPKNKTITYCNLGNRSALAWFVLKYLLGYEEVLNYDGSWLEWGNMIRTQIVRESDPKTAD